LNDLLGRVQCAGDFIAKGSVTNGLDKVLDYLKGNVGF
jgi:hypothetical protein